MKSIKILIFAALLSVASLGAEAQTLKFGHIDSQKFLSEQPAFIEAQSQLQEESRKLEEQMKVMSNDIQQKYTDYISKRDSLPELIRATKEKEIQDTQDRIQSFQQLAQQSLQQKEQQLLAPIIESYNAALEAVGSENGFTYIFDTSSQIILYQSDKSIDVSPLVKVKMNSSSK